MRPDSLSPFFHPRHVIRFLPWETDPGEGLLASRSIGSDACAPLPPFFASLRLHVRRKLPSATVT